MGGEILTCLEMTSPGELAPARRPPGLQLERAGADAALLLRSAYVRVGAPLGWTGRSGWSVADWEEELARPGIEAWVARLRDEVIGFVELEAEPSGDVGIVVLGLFPEFIGRGHGGALLTLATELAWRVTTPDGTPARRVWVQTSSRDHPHARANYEARGFRIFRREHAVS
jgi:ribosomal protein S18 acetylase RimI-like enzyme